MLGVYIFTTVIPFSGLIPWSLFNVLLCLLLLFVLTSILSGIGIATPTFFSVSVYMEYLFPSPHFQSVCVTSDLNWVFCRQHIYESCFCIHLATLCLLIGALSPFTFKVMTVRYVFIGILLIVFWVIFVVLFSFFCSLPCDLMTIFSVMFGFLSFVCVYQL